MNNVYKGKANYISASILVALMAVVMLGQAGNPANPNEFDKSLTTDTIPAPTVKKLIGTDSSTRSLTDTSQKSIATGPNDSTTVLAPKLDTFDVKVAKDSLDAPVYYHAEDSMVMQVPDKKIILYGKQTTTKYQDNELTAPGITFDQKNNLVTASFLKDSTGNVIASPTFKQGEMITVSDSISFNPKTGKGLSKGTYTQQGEMYVYGERIKKVDTSSFYAFKARITTCNLDTPHFAFVSRKIKFINKKFAVTGPVHPEFEGVPVPIILPFGIYPMYQGRHSGLIAPTFTANNQFGIALEGLGYYKVFNDNWDLVTRATLYSYGGWNVQLAPRYYKRYRYQGNFNIDFQRTKLNFKGDPDYSVTNTFKLMWSHSMDSKARPGVTFSANVNVSSSKFNQLVPNSPITNFNNLLTSSINYTKVWKDKPFNMSVSANHQQNTVQRTITATLPNLNFNMNTIYPFRRKEASGAFQWYENIGIALNTSFQNSTSFSDDTLIDKRPIFNQITSNMLWGVRHNVPISLTLPPLGPVQVAPGISYSETWYQKKSLYRWNPTSKRLDTIVQKGFYTARDMAFSLGASTRIFGMFGFNKTSTVQAIRHEIRPTVSISYKPDMNGYSYYNTQLDSLFRFGRYSYYQGNINPAYSEGRFGGISFGIDNNIQMKVRNKKDTTGGEDAVKKVTLIDGFSINGGYNFLVDSFRLSSLSMSARTNLFDKVNITFGGTLDPYQFDSTGRRIDKLVWKNKALTLGRMTNANISISSSFRGGDQNKNNEKKRSLSNGVNPYTGMPLTDEQAEAAYISNNPAEYADFSIPWSINFAYSLRFNEVFNRLTRRFTKNYSSDISLNGTLNLTPKWQLGLNTIYNFTTKEVGVVSVSVSREMHCWQMAINVAPVGRFKFFNIVISPKSPLLRDIKVNRTRNFFDL